MLLGVHIFFSLFAFYIVSLQNNLCRNIRYNYLIFNEINKYSTMDKSENSLVEGLERLSLIASRIRKNEGSVPQIEIDIILEELRNLYMVALQIEKEKTTTPVLDVLEFDMTAAREKAEADQRKAQEVAAKKAAEEKRLAEEAAAKKAAEEKRLAEEAAAKKAAEEKRLAEEAAAKKAAEEKRLAEEAAAKKAVEEKRLAEEAAAKKAAEEKRLAEEAAAKKAAEEKRLAEEAAARKAAEAKRLAEEAARKAEEEKRKAAAAAAAIAAAELKPVFAPEEPAKAEVPIMEPQMEKLAGNPNDELFADEPAPVKKEKKKETSLFDYISKDAGGQPKRTLADTLNHPAHNIEEQLDSRVRSKKVDDLRTIININDKFSFMSELFHNNMKAYNDFIMRLNATTERAEALDYVKTVAEEYRWDEGSVVVQSFYKIFDRKF